MQMIIYSYFVKYLFNQKSCPAVKAMKRSEKLCSSKEGQMEWIRYSDLSTVKTVDDFDGVLKVMNTPELTEFQYLVSEDEWTVSVK